MCGLIAWFGVDGAELPLDGLQAGLARVQRRGPDGEGEWREDAVYLGHRRLAVLDLDRRAAQPMTSSCGRYRIVFNGEIYNFRELRSELEHGGVAFRTTSDTEVILALFAAQGEAMLPRLHGMFALVIWDATARRALVARDPYGIKPLYAAQTPSGVVIASQVKGVVATGLVSREPDLRAQADFWMLGSVPEPRTWWRDVAALPAGHCAWVERGRLGAPRCWADIGASWRRAEEASPAPAEIRSRVADALRESVARHQVSDVPVGVFLSGGIDSSVLASLMAENERNEVRGITIAYREFAGQAQDEAPWAARIAQHYGLTHVVRQVSRDEFLGDLPRLFEAMDQPSIDGVNTWYASKAAAECGLKVVVSGVGGDELFQGYSSFRSVPRLVRLRNAMLPGFGIVMGGLGRWRAHASGNRRWRHVADWSRTVEGAWWLRRSLFAPEDLPAIMGDDAAHEALCDFDVVARVRAMAGILPRDLTLAYGQIESCTYLRNQLLRDSDWASMDHSIELRTPLVDVHLLHNLEPCLGLFRRFAPKELLRDAPRRALPAEILAREKTGFGIPLATWLAERRPRAAARWAPEWAQELVPNYEHSR